MARRKRKPELTEDFLRGLHHGETFTLTGIWGADLRPTCGICGARFTEGPEGVPVISSNNGLVRTVACYACAIAMVNG